MIIGGQTEARASTIIDYHGPFDQGLKRHKMEHFAVTCLKEIESFLSTAIMDAKLCALFFLTPLDETTL